MRILIAPDKFKGSLSATIVAQTIAEALKMASVGDEIDLCPIADGGEGTAEAIISAKKGSWRGCQTVDAQNRLMTAQYGQLASEAVLEMSAASGLAIISDLPLQPASANTYGTGLMMLDAIRQGAEKIIIGLGGSATNDAGTGMAHALGFRFLDEHGLPLCSLPQDLNRLHHIQAPTSWNTEVLVACDVTNPLLGPEGCTRVYGPQKGVTNFAFFETRLERLTQVVERDLGVNPAEIPGSGAAGGLGFGLMAFCGAKITSGFDLIAELIDLECRIQAADLVITGEGRIDAQTLHGKGPMGVARIARAFGKPVAAIAGLIESRDSLTPHFDHLIQVKPESMTVSEAIRNARELLINACRDQLMPRITTVGSSGMCGG